MIFKFKIANGKNSEIMIKEPMLDSEASATERANAEFIVNSYSKRDCSFSTVHTDIVLGEIIQIQGLPFKVVSVDITSNKVEMYSSVKGERYET